MGFRVMQFTRGVKKERMRGGRWRPKQTKMMEYKRIIKLTMWSKIYMES